MQGCTYCPNEKFSLSFNTLVFVGLPQQGDNVNAKMTDKSAATWKGLIDMMMLNKNIKLRIREPTYHRN